MKPENKKLIDRRLARLEGQIGGLRRMVEEDRYCIDILTQLAAARSALDQLGAQLAASHVQTCILGQHGHPQSKAMSEDELVEELKTTLSRLMR
jgi:DNA-binding FrmR family transcriptional regulator